MLVGQPLRRLGVHLARDDADRQIGRARIAPQHLYQLDKRRLVNRVAQQRKHVVRAAESPQRERAAHELRVRVIPQLREVARPTCARTSARVADQHTAVDRRWPTGTRAPPASGCCPDTKVCGSHFMIARAAANWTLRCGSKQGPDQQTRLTVRTLDQRRILQCRPTDQVAAIAAPYQLPAQRPVQDLLQYARTGLGRFLRRSAWPWRSACGHNPPDASPVPAQ